jgi:hypothetical protein
MEPLFHFALALLSSGAPWLAGVIVVAIALAIVGPVKLSLSIGTAPAGGGANVRLPEGFLY